MRVKKFFKCRDFIKFLDVILKFKDNANSKHCKHRIIQTYHQCSNYHRFMFKFHRVMPDNHRVMHDNHRVM